MIAPVPDIHLTLSSRGSNVDPLTSFLDRVGRQIQGRHADFGLNCHTVRLADETDFEELAGQEAQRLNCLARLTIEQLENDEKIFLHHESFDTPEEAWGLHRLIRGYNSRARLLLMSVAPVQAPERDGRNLRARALVRGAPLRRAMSATLTARAT